LKDSVRNFVDFILVSRALEQKDFQTSLQLTRTGVLSHFQRAWALSETAALSKSSAANEAIELILEAISEAGRITPTSPESPQAWIAIARRAGEVDQTEKWDKTLEAIKAVNRAPDYSGEEHDISVGFRSENNSIRMQIAAPSSSVAALFGALAEEDLYRAVDIARGIAGESPRSIALLAATRSTFVAKPMKSRRQ
jgi:hypothetical protein